MPEPTAVTKSAVVKAQILGVAQLHIVTPVTSGATTTPAKHIPIERSPGAWIAPVFTPAPKQLKTTVPYSFTLKTMGNIEACMAASLRCHTKFVN